MLSTLGSFLWLQDSFLFKFETMLSAIIQMFFTVPSAIKQLSHLERIFVEILPNRRQKPFQIFLSFRRSIHFLYYSLYTYGKTNSLRTTIHHPFPLQLFWSCPDRSFLSAKVRLHRKQIPLGPMES